MGGGARFRVGIALSAIGEGLREAARDFGGATLRCVCLPLSTAGSGHPPHRFLTPSNPLAQCGVQPFPGSIQAELPEAVVDAAPGWEIVGKQAPRTAAPQ